jgi:hypothetical protein
MHVRLNCQTFSQWRCCCISRLYARWYITCPAPEHTTSETLLLLQVCRLVIDAARQAGKRVVLVRHPMVRHSYVRR